MSLNCSKMTQGIFVIHTVFNSVLTVSFLNQLNPIFFWKILCSIVRKRLQQYRSHGIPMTWSILFSFVLIVMTMRRIDVNNYTLSFVRGNGGLFEQRTTGRTVEIVCTSFLVAISTFKMVNKSVLDSIIGFFYARFSPFWFLKCWEQSCAGSEFIVVFFPLVIIT